MYGMNRSKFYKRFYKEGFEMPRLGIKNPPKGHSKYFRPTYHGEDDQVYWGRFSDIRTDLEYVVELSKKDGIFRMWRCTPPFVNRNSRGIRDRRADD